MNKKDMDQFWVSANCKCRGCNCRKHAGEVNGRGVMGSCCLTPGPTDLTIEPPAAVCHTWSDVGCCWAGHSWLLPSLPRVPDPVSLPLACTGSLGLRTTGLLGRVGFCQIRSWLSMWFDNCTIWYKYWEWKMADFIWNCTLPSVGLRWHLCGWTFSLKKKNKLLIMPV